MDSSEYVAFTNFNTNGVEVSDTLNDWRKKTNGIVVELDSIKGGSIDNNSIVLEKIEQVANLKVLGNTSGSTANVSEVSILDEDTLSSNSATALATQQSIKAYVDNQFDSDTYDLSTNGYQILPSGLIMQWGVSDRTDAYQEEEEITFPIAFPNACLNVIGIPDYTTKETGGMSLYIKSFTTTKATFQYDSDGRTYSAGDGMAIRWQAFGY